MIPSLLYVLFTTLILLVFAGNKARERAWEEIHRI